MWGKSVLHKLEKVKHTAHMGGGQARIDKQHANGKLSVWERIELLFDDGSFTEVGGFVESRIEDFGANKKRVPGDGVVTGYGYINGRLAFAAAEDFTVHGGTMGEYHLKKMCAIQDMAYDMKAPIIFINDSGGARIEEGIVALAEMGGLFYRNTRASGVIPQIAVIMGPCAGGACYSPAICDFIFMMKDTGFMFLTGPKVVKTVIFEDVSPQDLGGAEVNAKKSGVAHFVYDKEQACLEGVRSFLSYLPQNFEEKPPAVPGKVMDLCKGLPELVVQNQRKCYDMHAVIGAMADKQSFFEVHKDFARNAIVGLGRIDGETVGFVANQPNFMGGSLDYNASDKIARFIRFCDCFNIPLVTLIDVPAFLPGKEQEYAGIIRHGAKMLYAYSEASVPKVSLILRKAYGGAYIAMNSKLMSADVVFAWPIAEIAVMGAEGAVDILFHRKVKNADDPEAERNKLADEYKEKFMNPYIAAAKGFVDEIIRPEETRKKISSALQMLKEKKTEPVRKKHGNMPL